MQGDDAATGRVELELLGARVDVVVGGVAAPELEKSIRVAWDRCLATEPLARPSAEIEVVLDSDPSVVAVARNRGAVAGADHEVVMSSLTSTLTLKAIELQHGRLLMLHACALADPDTGNAVVLVAPSGTGKTTAALTLGRELGYLTDETAAIGPDDVVVPYPKPLSLLVDGQPPKRQTSPTDLGLLPVGPESRVVALALLDRADEHVAPTVETVPVLEALAAIAEQSSAIHLLPRPLHLIADLLQRTGGLRRLRYRDVSDAAPLVHDLLRSVSR